MTETTPTFRNYHVLQLCAFGFAIIPLIEAMFLPPYMSVKYEPGLSTNSFIQLGLTIFLCANFIRKGGLSLLLHEAIALVCFCLSTIVSIAYCPPLQCDTQIASLISVFFVISILASFKNWNSIYLFTINFVLFFAIVSIGIWTYRFIDYDLSLIGHTCG